MGGVSATLWPWRAGLSPGLPDDFLLSIPTGSTSVPEAIRNAKILFDRIINQQCASIEQDKIVLDLGILRSKLVDNKDDSPLNSLPGWISGAYHPLQLILKQGDKPSILFIFRENFMRPLSLLRQGVVILECEGPAAENISQGTAFHIGGGNFLTCAHVLEEQTRAFTTGAVGRKHEVHVIDRNDALDVALIKCDLTDIPVLSVNLAPVNTATTHATAIGFPAYNIGDSTQTVPLTVTGTRQFSGFTSLVVAGGILGGMSGGPVLDSEHRVVGIAFRGGRVRDDSSRHDIQAAISIEAVLQLPRVKELLVG
ncbi:S1 family peptidase [Corallococcus exiguus]|uniref:S1 family peptidase n=1 Tax=Corallococcus exiguus TaxID=83462 RepID=UPI001560A6BB|nr:serine protease [Corallococcus exiguus]NRD51613.1 trypsin-like peptidase domain-containing protein [Corallococcus exiguus]